MSDKSAYDCFVTRIWYRDGQRLTDRKRLQIPLDMALRRFNRLSNLQIREAVNDLYVELERREFGPPRKVRAS